MISADILYEFVGASLEASVPHQVKSTIRGVNIAKY